MSLFSKAAAHGLAALIDIRCSRYVRSSINQTDAADPRPGKVTPCRVHVIGEAGGMIGTLTRRVTVLEQQRLGMQPEDGRAGMNVSQALQRESSTP
jgi:hypothetical protein